MKITAPVVGALALAMTTTSVAQAEPRFVDPVLDDAAGNLQQAAISLAIAQNERQQEGDWESAEAIAPILTLLNFSLGQLAFNEDYLNHSIGLDELVNSLVNQANLAEYYRTYEADSPWQTGPEPDPYEQAESAQYEFWESWDYIEYWEEPDHC